MRKFHSPALFSFLIIFCSALCLISPASADENLAPCCTTNEIDIALNGADGVDGKATLPEATKPADDSSKISITALFDIDFGRVFQEQAFTLTHHPVAIGDVIVNWNNWCGEGWRGQSIDGRGGDEETDGYVCYNMHFGTATLQANVAVFELPHSKEVWRFHGSLSYPVSDECTGTAYFDVMRGGFVTEVPKIEGTCSFPIGHNLAFSPKVQLSYDTKFDVTAVGFDLGIDAKVGGIGIRPFVKGYQTVSGHGPTNEDFGAIVGVTLGKNFSL